MAYPGLLHPEPPLLRQATADTYLRRKHSNILLASLCGVSGSWCTQGLFPLCYKLLYNLTPSPPCLLESFFSGSLEKLSLRLEVFNIPTK